MVAVLVVLAATARVLGIGEQLGRGLCLMRRAVTARASQRLLIESDVKSFMVVLPSQHCRPLDARSLT